MARMLPKHVGAYKKVNKGRLILSAYVGSCLLTNTQPSWAQSQGLISLSTHNVGTKNTTSVCKGKF
jgi:hypothetical protein